MPVYNSNDVLAPGNCPPEYFSSGVKCPPMGTKSNFWHSGSAIGGDVENERPTSIKARRLPRWMKVILTAAMSGLLGGFLVSYAFAPNYTSQSLVLVGMP